jgi:hypothetical protein
MTSNVGEARAFAREEFLFRKIPFAPGLGLLGVVLDRQGVPARHYDGRIAPVERWDVAGIGASECRKHILRDPKAASLTPTYTVFAHCVADLTLRSGKTALAIFKAVVTTFDIEYELGTISRGSALVPVPVNLAEAERLCALNGCGVRPP